MPYVPLDSDYAHSVSWSNDPGHLALQTYFNPNKPNLGGDFLVHGLRPILREDEEPYRFILKDNKDRYYVWNEFDGRLFWVRHAELEEMTGLEDKVDFVLCGLGALEVEPVYRDKHPAEDPELATIRATFPKYRI